MREHKYRGLTKDGKEVEGYYVNAAFRDGIGNVSTKHYIIPDEDAIVVNRHNSIAIFSSEDYISGLVEVTPESVGEFTGKQDSKRTKEFPKGQDIYEGDIVRLKHGTHGQWHENLVITWGEYGFFAKEAWSKQQGYSLDATEIEVISNEHQPEGEHDTRSS